MTATQSKDNPIAHHADGLTEAKMQRRQGRRATLWNRKLLLVAFKEALLMLNPMSLARNPVMFVTEIGAALTTLTLVFDHSSGETSLWYVTCISFVLWLTVLLGNFAEAFAEARGRAQADTLKKTRRSVLATKITQTGETSVSSEELDAGDLVVVSEGEIIPRDGDIVKGAASVDESAITGESAPVIREAGGDRSGVTGGTRVLSDRIVIRITARRGESFLDRMIGLVEGASRQRTPNELALTVILAGLTLIFVVVAASLLPIARYFGVDIAIPTLVALMVCLIPTTIGALLAAIGIAGMDRALAANVLAKSGKAVELAGDIDTLLLDKTGTITIGDRQASEFYPLPGISVLRLAEAAARASYGDETPEGRSIVTLGVEGLGLNLPEEAAGTKVIPFNAHFRLSGIDTPSGEYFRKGAPDAIRAYIQERRGQEPPELQGIIEQVASGGSSPIAIATDTQVLGVVGLSDILKAGIRDRIERLRAIGLRVVMVTGDNPLTAKAIAEQAGVNDYMAEAKPEDKLDYIRREQNAGRLIAMMGDGTNDAPALAQADIGVAMNSGTQAAKEAGNMVDLDSDPTKLIEIIEIGKQLLMTRGALTTFSIANDVAKYFALVPAIFLLAIPQLAVLNVMNLTTPQSAVLSALIFNAIIIPLLIPIAIRGVKYRPMDANAILRKNLLVYGLGGVLAPFAGIKAIDLMLGFTGIF